MGSSRLTRALRLLGLVQSGHSATADYLANALECSKRTVFRDIKLLNNSGITVCYEERLGGYTAESPPRRPITPPNDDELVGLLVAAILSPVAQLAPFAGPVSQAVSKMMDRASPEVKGRVNSLEKAIIPSSQQLQPEELRVFRHLVDAISRRRQVRIGIGRLHGKSHTGSPDASPLPRSTKLSPYQLKVVDCRWSVVGRSTVHRGEVAIALADIDDVEVTEDTYDVPVEYLKSGWTREAAKQGPKSPLGAIPPPPEHVSAVTVPKAASKRPER